MITKLFPILQMAVCAGAAVVYALAGDMRKAIYWSAAFVITATVTF